MYTNHIMINNNAAFKVAKMREAIMEDQDEFLMRNSEHFGGRLGD